MALTTEQKKKLLYVLLALFVLLLVWRLLTPEERRTAELAFPRGTVATSPVRTGLAVRDAASKDPLAILLERKHEKYPGVSRDLFRMANPAPKPKVVLSQPVAPPLPVIPEKTPEQIAEETSRADLSKFRFLGYLTDKDNTLFLSKDGELFIVKSGDRVLRNYSVKEAAKDYVVLLDTITRVEVRVELSGGAEPQQYPQAPSPPFQRFR